MISYPGSSLPVFAVLTWLALLFTAGRAGGQPWSSACGDGRVDVLDDFETAACEMGGTTIPPRSSGRSTTGPPGSPASRSIVAARIPT
jgi:hypothetical protein